MLDPHQDNRERLLDVATDLFAARGFKGTSIRDIAREMGMSISNIYHYFGNKDGLLLAILKRSSVDVVTRLQGVLATDIEPVEKLKHLLRTHICLCAEYCKATKVFFLDEEHLSEEGVRINQELQREVFNAYLSVLGDLKKTGVIKRLDIKVLAFNLLGIVNWQLRWYRPEGRLTVEEVADEIILFALYGISGSPAKKIR